MLYKQTIVNLYNKENSFFPYTLHTTLLEKTRRKHCILNLSSITKLIDSDIKSKIVNALRPVIRTNFTKMKNILYILTILLCPLALSAQLPEQNCISAIPLCQNSYSFANSFNGIGVGSNEINASNSCLPNGEQNGVWFKFTVKTSGDLVFFITPNSISDDYNWSLFNLTDKDCSDIFSGNLETACNSSTALSNLAGSNAHTGAVTGHPYYGFLDPADPFEMDIPVVQGSTYALYVSNASNSTNGFSIDFGLSTAVLFNSATPSFLFIEPVNCGDGSLIVHFNKPILCNSIQATDFVLGGNTITNISSLACSQGLPDSRVYKLDLASPITNSGNGFALNLVSSIGDPCGNTTSSDAINFNVSSVVADAGDDFIFCKSNDISIQIGDTSANYSNTNFSWIASSPLVQNAISNTNIAAPTIILNNIPSDTVQLILNITSGSCSDQDTIYLYFRDCCKNYDTQIASIQNINCYGASTGQVTATAIGSVSGFNPTSFTYAWSNADQVALTTGLTANTNYIVTVTDQLGCSDVANVILTQPNSPITTATTGSILACHGDNSGTIELSVSGATPPYSYQWSNNETTEDLDNLMAGTYTVTITDANNCTITATENVTQPPTPMIITGTGSTIACGATTGSINISVSGGGSPYVYAWSNGATSQNISGLMPGTYTVIISDQYGCSIPQDFIVNTLNNLTASTTSTDAVCTTSPTGTASVMASGGQSPYTYAWSYSSQTAQNLSNLPTGLYTVTVTDATNCQVIASANIGQLASLSVSASIQPISCSGGSDGGIDLTVLSNDPNNSFNYNWSNNATTQDLTNLSAGSYQVTVSDQNGCSSSGSFNMTSPTPVSANTTVMSISCHGGNDGIITANASGGGGFYMYQWANNLGNSGTINNISTGNYSVTITDSKGCTASTSTFVGEPNPLIITLSSTPVACSGNATGSITTSATGGTGSYSFNWDNGIGNVQNPTNLSAGIYNITVTDGNGCIKTASTTISQLSTVNVAIQNAIDLTCNGANDGSISLSITNGIAPFSYNWTNGIGNTPNPTNLSAGNYAVTITDANGCTATTSTTLTQPTPLIINPITNPTSCNGNNDGAVALIINGGTAPFSYNWSNGIANTNIANNLLAGNYSVTVTDVNNCSAVTTAVVTQPTSISASLVSTDLNCFGSNNGSISTSVTGGTAPYNYTWNNGVTNIPNPNNLAAGVYNLIVSDNNGCTSTTTTTISAPSQTQITMTATDLSCFGVNDGSISTSVTGGTQPYSFTWNNGAPAIQSPSGLSANLYTGVIIDANNCILTQSIIVAEPAEVNLMTANISPPTCNNSNGTMSVIAGGGVPPYNYQWSNNTGITTNTTVANNLSNGIYQVSVTDENGCSDAINGINFAAHPAFYLNENITHPVCVPDSGQIQIIGIASYTYQWDANAGSSTSNMVNNLQDGNYTVTVSDGTCDTVLNFTINPINLVDYTNNSVDESCGQENGSVTININSGVAPFNFDWNIQPNPGNTNTVTNLAAGDYPVLITDGNGCLANDIITVNGTNTLDVPSSVQQPTCVQMGSIILTPVPGIYTYNWNNSSIGNVPNPTNLNAGNYLVTVTNDNNCEAELIFDLATIGEFQIILEDIQDNECPDGAEGLILLSTTSDAITLDYDWSNQATTEDLTNLSGGIYTINIIDPATGCEAAGTYEIFEPQDFTVDLPEDISISPGEVVTLTAQASDVSVIYSWAGVNGFISNNPSISVSPSETTIYSLTVSLPNCPPKVYQVQVFVTNQGNVLIPDAFSPNNDGLNDDFFIYTKNGIRIIEFQVFNKWGEKMHDDSTQGWNGTYRNSLMQNDAYVYVVKLEYTDGTEEMLKGQFLLIR